MTPARRACAALVAALALPLSLNAPMHTAPPPVRILAIGDSITADGRWQAELGRLLDAADVPHVIETEALSGSRCSRWPPLIASLLAAHQPDMVILACGTNDDPTEQVYGESRTGWSWRATVEAVHAWRPADPVLVLPVLIGYSDPLLAPDWLLGYEPRTNDILWSQMVRYLPPAVSPSWLAGVVNLQVLPATATYLDDGGVHPTARGYQVIGRLAYDAAASGMGWPGAAEPALCDMYGHRRGYPRPAYTPCP